MKNEEFLEELKNVILKHHKEDDIEIEYYPDNSYYWWDGSDFIKEDKEEMNEVLIQDKLIQEGRAEEAKSLNKYFEEKNAISLSYEK